jgi:hypothetical protein
MSFTSTFNSLSTNGWSADSTGNYSLISRTTTGNIGADVAISQNGLYAIASNPDSNSSGIVKVYTINNSSVLTLQANIIANNQSGNIMTKFGDSLDINADGSLLIGGGFSGSTGNARVYTRSGTTWTYEHQFNPPVPNTYWYGNTVAINNDGNQVIIGQNYFGAANAEIIFTYERSESNTWSLLASIPAPANAASGRGFGPVFAMDGNSTFAVGVFRDNTYANFAGAAYVYNTSGTQLAQLIAPDAAANNQFGTGIAMSNDGTTIVVGSTTTNKAYIFRGSESSWTHVQTIANTDTIPGTIFPQKMSLSADGSRLFISAGPSAYLAGDSAVLCYIDNSNSNNWQYQQSISVANTGLFGDSNDTNSNGVLLLCSAGPNGTNSPVGNLFLFGQ